MEAAVACSPASAVCPGASSFSYWPKLFQVSIIEGSLEVKLPTIWTGEKQSREEAERRERLEERRSERSKSQKKEDADARKSESRETLCFSHGLWLRRVEKWAR